MPTILLVHGATVPCWEFDRLVPHLRAAGLRTVRFDLFGHGLSDRTAVEYDFALFLGQALEVLDGMNADRPLTVLGHSFGAALAAAVTNQRPQRVERLVLVAPLLDFMTGSLLPRIFGLPGIGGHLMPGLGLPGLKRRRKRRYASIGAPTTDPKVHRRGERTRVRRGTRFHVCQRHTGRPEPAFPATGIGRA